MDQKVRGSFKVDLKVRGSFRVDLIVGGQAFEVDPIVGQTSGDERKVREQKKKKKEKMSFAWLVIIHLYLKASNLMLYCTFSASMLQYELFL